MLASTLEDPTLLNPLVKLNRLPRIPTLFRIGCFRFVPALVRVGGPQLVSPFLGSFLSCSLSSANTSFLSNSPPQVWHVEMLYTKHLGKVIQLVRSERLGEDVGNLPIRLNILKFNFTAQNLLMHKVIVHFYVLCLSMEYGVLGKLYDAYVVAIDQDWGRYLNLEVFQQSSKLDGFIGGNDSTTIFSLNARQTQSWLLFAAPRNNRTTKREHIAGGGSMIR